MEELIKKFFECYDKELEKIIKDVKWDLMINSMSLDGAKNEMYKSGVSEDCDYIYIEKNYKENKEHFKRRVEELQIEVDILNNKLTIYEDLKKELLK